MAAKPKVTKTLANVLTGEAKLYDLIDKLEANRLARRPIEQQLAPLEDEMKSLKEQIMTTLDDMHETKGRTTHATVSISEIERIAIDDIDMAYKALKKSGYLHCIDLKVVASREYLEKTGKDIPGTHREVVRRQLNHTSVK